MRLCVASLLALTSAFRAPVASPLRPGARGGKRTSAAFRARVALPAATQESFLEEGVRGPGRVLGIGLLWSGLIAYIALLAPGKSEAAQALDSELLAKLVANPFDESCPAFFTVLFNWMGVWPAVYASLVVSLCVLVGFATSLDEHLNLFEVAVAAFLSYSVTGDVVGKLYES